MVDDSSCPEQGATKIPLLLVLSEESFVSASDTLVTVISKCPLGFNISI